MIKVFLAPAVCLALIGCADGFVRDNPFDREAPEGIQAPATLCGTVFSDLKDELSPLPGAEVSIVELGLNAETDERGYFSFSNLAAGTWRLVISDGQPSDSEERHLDFRESFTVAPGEEPDCWSVTLTAIPATPTLLSVSGTSVVGTGGGAVTVRYASPKVDAGCIDIGFTSARLGDSEVSKATVSIADTELVGSAKEVEVREFSVDVIEASDKALGTSALSPSINAMDTYDVNVRTRRTSRDCSDYKGAASGVSSSLRYAFQVEAQATSNDDTLRGIEEDDFVSKLHLTERGGLVTLYNSGKLTYSTEDGIYLGCLDLGQTLGASLALQESSNNFKRIRERDGSLYIVTEGLAFRLTRVDEAQLISELAAAIDTSSCATSSASTETLWQRPKTLADSVKGLIVGEESWGVVTVLGTEARVFRGSLRESTDDSIIDTGFQTDGDVTPTSHEIVSDPVFTSAGLICSLKAKSLNDNHFIAYYPNDAQPYYLTVPYQPGKIIQLSDDLFVAVVGSRSWDLSLTFLALNQGAGTLHVIETIRPREAISHLEYVPITGTSSGVLVMSGADRPALILSNLNYLNLRGPNPSDVTQILIQLEERGDTGVYGFDTVSNDFDVDVGILTDLTTRSASDNLEICSAFNRKASHVCVGLTP